MTDPWKGFNPFESRKESAEDLYTIVNRIRESDPVWRTPIGIFIISRYADVERLLKHTACGVRTRAGTMPSLRPRPADHPRDSFMLSNDPPTHTRLRKLVQQAFTPRFGDGVDVMIGPGRPALDKPLAAAGITLDGLGGEKGRALLSSLSDVPPNATRAIVLLDSADFDPAAAVELARRMLSRNAKGYFLMVEWDTHTDSLRRGLDRIHEFIVKQAQ
jgi:hypothetical protein